MCYNYQQYENGKEKAARGLPGEIREKEEEDQGLINYFNQSREHWKIRCGRQQLPFLSFLCPEGFNWKYWLYLASFIELLPLRKKMKFDDELVHKKFNKTLALFSQLDHELEFSLRE